MGAVCSSFFQNCEIRKKLFSSYDYLRTSAFALERHIFSVYDYDVDINVCGHTLGHLSSGDQHGSML